jgi:hypothetical protein
VPVEPPELTVELSIEGAPDALEAARAAGASSGTARDAGPGALLLSGRRGDVLDALDRAVRAALDAGAHAIDARFEAPTGVRA